MQATTISEVITRLESIIDDSIKTGNRAGYFAALYHKVTVAVKKGIEENQFENGPRMEKLDVIFANRYISAYDEWKKKGQNTGSWKVAFETTNKSSKLILQHLLLGMNAHINLDLGIAAVETTKGTTLRDIHHDFNNINAVISSLTYQVINDLNRVSPLLSLMGLHATNYNSILIQFSIGNARDGAWLFAEELSELSGDKYNKSISDRDKNITLLGESLIHANTLLRITLWVVHLFEWKKPSRIIKALTDYQKVYIKAAQL